MDAANRYLEQVYLPNHNTEFALPASEAGSAFVPYIGVSYARNGENIGKAFKPLPMNAEALAGPDPDNDARGPWKSNPATAQAGHGTKSQFYVVTAPNGKQHKLPSGRCWVFTESVVQEMIASGKISFGESGNNVPRIKTFLHEKERGLTPETILFANEASTNEEAKNALKEIFDGHSPFETPKPPELVTQFLQMCTQGNDLILDSFAGSGTTGHAVLKQNVEDGGNRRFILVEMDENIARNVTTERVKRVATGYTNAKGDAVEGLGAGFQFCRLSAKPLFTAEGQIRPDVSFPQLAEFVWFAETGTGYSGNANSPLIGVHDGRAIYLLYNGILKDRSAGGGNVLTGTVYDGLPRNDGPKVIYAAACRLGTSRLMREGIVFKQTPYALEV